MNQNERAEYLAQTYADAHDLPGYPRAGAIVDCGDYVLVNLQ